MSWSWASGLEPALLVPPCGSAYPTWVVVKLAEYLSLGYTIIIQGVDGTPFCPGQILCCVHSQNTEIQELLSPMKWVLIRRGRTLLMLWLRSGNWWQHLKSHIKPSRLYYKQAKYFSVIYCDYVIRLYKIGNRYFLQIWSWSCCYYISSIFHTKFENILCHILEQNGHLSSI